MDQEREKQVYNFDKFILTLQNVQQPAAEERQNYQKLSLSPQQTFLTPNNRHRKKIFESYTPDSRPSQRLAINGTPQNRLREEPDLARGMKNHIQTLHINQSNPSREQAGQLYTPQARTKSTNRIFAGVGQN